jgi:hypothetical protein
MKINIDNLRSVFYFGVNKDLKMPKFIFSLDTEAGKTIVEDCQITIDNLPDGVSVVDNQLVGVPQVIGDYTVTISIDSETYINNNATESSFISVLDTSKIDTYKIPV